MSQLVGRDVNTTVTAADVTEQNFDTTACFGKLFKTLFVDNQLQRLVIEVREVHRTGAGQQTTIANVLLVLLQQDSELVAEVVAITAGLAQKCSQAVAKVQVGLVNQIAVEQIVHHRVVQQGVHTHIVLSDLIHDIALSTGNTHFSKPATEDRV